MKKTDARKIVNLLKEAYPDATCSLDFKTPFQLVVAVMLSAQCTDERVNKTTPELFNRCKTIEDFANIDINKLEQIIHPCGFYKNKAKNIKLCAKQVLENFNGEVPHTMEELTSLAGVGRKTANVIRGNIYREPSIVVDTHVKRISQKLGLTKENDPVKIEYDLMDKLPKEQWILYNIQIITHGRNVCIARRPKCGECTLQKVCPSCEV